MGVPEHEVEGGGFGGKLAILLALFMGGIITIVALNATGTSTKALIQKVVYSPSPSPRPAPSGK